MQKGDPELAISKYFDPVIAHYEELRKNSKKRYFSANNQVQTLIYLALPAAADERTEVQVLDSTWGAAYLLKAYALIELHRIADAQSALQAAIALSPMDSQYKSELAYTYQVQKDCDRSIAMYSEAASDAESFSDESTKTDDLTRAWRGQGYCLVEQGKWAEAAAMYEKCLALDPNDSKAKGELAYVKQHQPK
jgi:tetratricopeptide (TPR) repeat protein